MSSKSKRKPLKLQPLDDNSLETLKVEAGQFANAFQLINQSTFPASKALAVHTAMIFLDENYARLEAQIKEIAPQEFEKAPEAAPEAAPTADQTA